MLDIPTTFLDHWNQLIISPLREEPFNLSKWNLSTSKLKGILMEEKRRMDDNARLEGGGFYYEDLYSFNNLY